MRRGLHRVRRDIVVRVAQHVRRKEQHRAVDQQEHTQPEAVLRRVVRVEGNGIALGLHFNARGVRRTRDMQRPDVQDNNTGNHEGHQEVQRIEAVERGVIRRKTAKQPVLDRLADQRDRPEQAGDDLRAPEAHLAPGKHVAHEGGGHHQQEDGDAQQPDHLARRLVGAVVEAAEDMEIDHDEERRSAVRVGITHHPAPVDVAHDVLGRIEGHQRVARVVHRQDNAGDDLQHEAETCQHAEIPEIVEVARNRITGADRVVDEARHRQPLVQPLHHRMAWLVFLGPGKAHGRLPQPIFTTVSVVNS